MVLQIITGTSKVKKGAFILDDIKEKLIDDPCGKPIFYIVPEQMTFQEEYALFEDGKVNGSTRAQVVSFSRLAWRVLHEVGGSTKQFMSDTGTQMMLRKIIDERVDDFKIFQKAADKQGFIRELDGIITEFKRHCITPEILGEHIQFAKEQTALSLKLEDLHYIYTELMHLFANKYVDGEDQLQLLVEKIAIVPFLQGADIYIDGFHRFTPKEYAIISELLQVADRMTIALTIPENQLENEVNELDLFYQTLETHQTLIKIAKEIDVLIEPIYTPQQQYDRFSNIPVMQHLEENFDVRPAPAFSQNDQIPIHIYEAVHPRAELEGVAQEILRLVREENYRYKDMVIYLRDAATYNDLIQSLFKDYGIPVFIDEKRTMLNHPLVEFLRSLLDCVETDWRYDAMFRLLKTGYFSANDTEHPLSADVIDQLENYCIEYGIRGKKQWLQEEDWKYNRFGDFQGATRTDKDIAFEKMINFHRKQIIEKLKAFDVGFKEARTVREKCENIYLLMESLNIPSQLERERTVYDKAGELEHAREHEQVWNGIIQLLDEAVEMIGNEVMDMKIFRSMFTSGLEALEFSHVPPSMDHIIVASIDHSRISGKKCSFLLGVNEGTWPMKPAIDGMINEQEREFLKMFGMELAASNRRVLLDDTFYMYLAFTNATDYMWVSYSLSDNEGSKKTVSQMVGRLKELFPNIASPFLLTEPEELQYANRFITTPMKTRSAMNVQFARYLRGYPLATIWQDVLRWYIVNEPTYGTTSKVLQSLFYENTPENLELKTVEQFYPKHVKASVSRLEMFYRCSYQHFVQYHLQLQNRRTYKLDAPDIGQLFHEAIKTITEWIHEEGRPFASMTKTEAVQYASKSVQHLAPQIQHHILSSSNRYKYIQKKLTNTIAKATYILSEQARLSGFSPIGIELSFGYDDGLDPFTISLSNGYEIMLRGRIDRVDESIETEQLFLRIIDYKSSSRGLDLADVYYGLALQMLTYLNVVLDQATSWLGREAFPAGILYFHVHDAMLQKSERIEDEAIEEEIFKKYKMSGLISAKEEIARLMDTSVESGWSDIAPIGFKKDGSFYSGSRVAGPDTFELLKLHMHRLIQQAGIEITTGKIQLNPYENSTGNACDFCEFKSICQFDPNLKENNYRKLTNLKEAEALERIKAMQEGGENLG